MNIEQRPITEIEPYDKNAKKHPDAQVKKIVNSIKEFGFNQPIVVDKDGVIIVGHGRFLAAHLIGMETVPVYVADLTDEQARAYRLADNKLNESEWDMGLVVEELKNLTDELLALTGFDPLEIDRYEWQQMEKSSLSDDFIIPPLSVWDTRRDYWQKRRKRWLEFFGDSREGRDDDLIGEGYKRLAAVQGAGKLTGTSEFDPVIAEICYKWFCVPEGKVLDPFAGGVVRGAVAGTLGYHYTGIDLSEKQILQNEERLKAIAVPITAPTYIQGDSTTLSKLLPKDEEYDFIFSCPPYFDLEVYSDKKEDISNAGNYDAFIKVYTEIIQKAVARLKPNRFAVFVVGDMRDADGYYRGFVRDTIAAFEGAGAKMYNDIILVNSIATAAVRSRKPFSQNRKVTKVHQNILAFYKGDLEALRNAYIQLPKVERLQENVVVFFKGDVEEIRKEYKVVHTPLDI